MFRQMFCKGVNYMNKWKCISPDFNNVLKISVVRSAYRHNLKLKKSFHSLHYHYQF